jgi:acyl transferase domain-containing protein/NAD(P)-dependent dehydrogenase (short-subunit alcohol dehydrogenase family)/acyl carrier protein
VHCAGAIADGTVETLGDEQVDRVFAPKVDAAWNLHELTGGLDLSAFVLFSAAAGTLGSPGQANYAAANVFLDTLAQARRARGLAALSIGWGLWERESGMVSQLGEADLERMRRGGIEAISDGEGLRLFDAALSADWPTALAMPLNLAGLRGLASVGALPPIFSALVRTPRRRSVATGSLATTLAGMPEAEREGHVLDLVRREVAGVLGHASPQDVEPTRAFQDLGFDSLAAVELRNRLSAVAGLRLSATVVFDYPSSSALAAHLLAEATAAGGDRQIAVRAQASEEPIAIVGMACRYPGEVSSPEELWRLVAEGRDGVSEFPADRGWDVERLYDPDPSNPGTSYTKEGGFIAAPGEFDAEFFGISPREALVTDPQQRLLLESCWEALEDAGIDPASLPKTQTGVFAGVMYQDYGPMPGMTSSIVSGRIAYTLGLEGPAISVDTACSSSLVAMHLASQALRQGECTLALAGGVTVLSTPGVFVEFSRQRGLAADGRSKSFSDTADGVGWAEGVGVLVLERLSEAQRNGHEVLAVLKGSAVNQDGASNGLTAPNGPSQERVIRQALANARLEPEDVDVVEAHGTGTTLGDPIEAGALLATYGQDREEPLKLGSIKSNIGHTQAAAGVAGVIKMTEAMRRGVLPKTLHVDEPSSKVDWEAGEIELLTEPVEWATDGRPRRAGISSFGVSGTNAHVILEEAPASQPSPAETSADGGEVGAAQPLPTVVPLVLSAKSEAALPEAAERLTTHLKANPDLDPTDIAYSLISTRSSFEHRAVALGKDREELLASLGALAEAKEHSQVAKGHARTTQKPTFLFPGQGAQAQGMALDLIEASPFFAEQMSACEQALAPHVDWSLTEVLREAEPKWLERLDIVQPALFAVMVSLAKLWISCGVEPGALIGHSQGEIAAAHIAGALSLEDAALIIANRGKAMAKIAGKGGMLSVSLGPEALPKYTEPYAERVSLAAINGPASLVLSGEPEALEQIKASCEQDGIRAKPIAVDYAAHSPQIEALEEELLEAFASIEPKATEIPLISTVTGEQIEGQELDASYWYRNLRQTVLLEPVLRSQLEAGKRAFLEIGPHPVLAFGAQETIEDSLDDPSEAILLSSLRRDEDAAQRFGLSLAEAHVNGVATDWGVFFAGSAGKRVPLPTYPFQRKRYWLAATTGVTDASAIGLIAAEHPMLGAAVELADGDGEGLLLTGRISLATHPWLADHTVMGTALMPGSAFLELALRAAEEASAESIEELTMGPPLVLSEAGAIALQVTVSARGEDGQRAIAIHCRAEGEDREWVQHATGTLSEQVTPTPAALDPWPPEGAEPLEVEYLYDVLAEAGLEYGAAFQGLNAAWRDDECVYAEVALPEDSAHEAQGFGIHPALLDAALHGITLRESDGQNHDLSLPSTWRGVSLMGIGARELRVRIASAEDGGDGASLLIADPAGAPVAAVAELAKRSFDPAELQVHGQRPDGLLEVEWREISLADQEAAPPEVELLRIEIEPNVTKAEAARKAAQRALEVTQGWISDEAKAESSLALITKDAMATLEDGAPDPAAAAIWGLVRSAQTEHPGRFALIDTDGSEASEALMPAVLAVGAEEPQLVLREGRALVPRLARVRADELGEDVPPVIDPNRTVLITGATGGLGALMARHLVEQHGARRLLLVSRSGPDTEGAAELQAELKALGAEVRIAACDVSDREALTTLLASIPDEHPLGAVIHAAGTLADGTIETLVPEQVDRVFGPKVDAAWTLHELTAGMDLSAFLLFSSAAGTLGGPGQANYAAANVFLDALAQKRQAEGLPATSVAWGVWERASGMTSALSEADLARMRRGGIEPLSDGRGLELFDSALGGDRATALAVPLNVAGLRALASAGALAPIFSGLVRAPRRHRAASGSLASKLASLPEAEHEAYVLELVRVQVAAMLGHASAQEVEPDKAFKELGFDSLAAVELRNRLDAVAGLRLPATVVFDHPSSAALATHLLAAVAPSDGGGPASESQEVEIRQALASIPLARLRQAGLIDPLLRLTGVDEEAEAVVEEDEAELIDAMGVEDLIRKSTEGLADEPEGEGTS